MTTALQIPMSDYVADRVGAPVPTLSSSLAHRLLTRSPLHAWTKHPRLNPDYQQETSDSFDLGSAVHAVFLERNESIIAVGEFPDWRTNASQEFRQAARAQGKIPMLPDQAEQVKRMAYRASTAVATSPDLLGMGDWLPEQTIVYQHNGVWLRTRPDTSARDGSVVVSYKTTSTIGEPAAFVRTLLSYGYEMQGAFESNGWKALTGRAPLYVWCVQEVQEPYAVSLIGFSEELEAYAQRRFEQAVEQWGLCLASDSWPGYSDRVHWAALPPWLMKGIEE